MAIEFHPETGVLAEQFRKAEQAGKAVGQYGGIEFEIDFFPVVFGRLGVDALCRQKQGKGKQHGAEPEN